MTESPAIRAPRWMSFPHGVPANAGSIERAASAPCRVCYERTGSATASAGLAAPISYRSRAEQAEGRTLVNNGGILSIFSPDHVRHDGVRPITIFFLRLFYLLMATLLAKDAWTFILNHQKPWQPYEATAWSVWAAVGLLAASGVLYPLRMLPIILFDIIYKSIWLVLVALPHIRAGTLAGSSAEATTYVYAPIILLALITPWGYVFRTYIYDFGRRHKA